jgi:hypothetical protein
MTPIKLVSELPNNNRVYSIAKLRIRSFEIVSSSNYNNGIWVWPTKKLHRELVLLATLAKGNTLWLHSTKQ